MSPQWGRPLPTDTSWSTDWTPVHVTMAWILLLMWKSTEVIRQHFHVPVLLIKSKTRERSWIRRQSALAFRCCGVFIVCVGPRESAANPDIKGNMQTRRLTAGWDLCFFRVVCSNNGKKKKKKKTKLMSSFFVLCFQNVSNSLWSHFKCCLYSKLL